jgi:hypothetical protein
MKGDGLLGRNCLKGMQGDAINTILRGAGPYLRKILDRLRANSCLLSREPGASLQVFMAHLESINRPQHTPQAALKIAKGLFRTD